MKINKIALTGGPCAGKTSAMAFLQQRLTSMGVNVFIVPEAATMSILGGVQPGSDSFQKGLLSLQGSLEEHFETMAKNCQSDSILLCDRGGMDGKAFISQEAWDNTLKDLGLEENSILSRYDGVIHMVTAADGAPEFYTLENNAARLETAEMAIAQDKKLQHVWLPHPKLKVIDNSTDFTTKIERVGKEVLHLLGLPEPVESEFKFAVPLSTLATVKENDIKVVKTDILQTYLLSPEGEERRVRKRSLDGCPTYYYCSKKKTDQAHVRIEKEAIINEGEYRVLLEQGDPNLAPIEKERHCFLFENTYFELDHYKNPDLPFATLEIETETIPKLPDFITESVDLTGNKEYSNSALARKAAKGEQPENPLGMDIDM